MEAASRESARRMKRVDLIERMLEQIGDETILVAGIGNASFDLRALAGDREPNFDMRGSMGQAI